MEPTSGHLQGAISKNFLQLSPQLQQAARYVLENPEDVATYSLRQIAHRSGLAPPTFSRLARAVGFHEYEALRDVCRTELKRNSMTLAQRAHKLQEGSKLNRGARGTFAAQHVASSLENISELYRKLDPEQLADVADTLATAERVVLLGALSSRAVLEYLHHMVSLAKPDWIFVNASTPSTSTLLADITKGTVVLSVSIRPYIRHTVQFAELANQYGAEVISISDDISSPILEHSTHSFLVPTESPQFFPSYVAVLTLLEILTGMLVRRWGEEANKRIDRVEKTSHAIGDYM
ncbi:MAG: MurR/RpiR family transcriptional regulator [Pseudomonadota bacterium]